MKEKSNVAIVDFKKPRDDQGKIVLHPSIKERAEEIAAEEYNKALREVLARAEKVIWD